MSEFDRTAQPGQPVAVCPSRRAVLLGLGGAGMASVLAACGGEANDSAGGGDNPGGPTTPSQNAPQSADPGGGSAALAATADVPVGGGVVVDGILLIQPVAGQFKAYSASCPHQGAVVSPPEGGVITCPAHRSTFKDSDGSRIAGPATKGLTPVPVAVQGSNIVKA